MSQQVTHAELASLEYSQVDLQELLGDALIEVQHHRELQSLDGKNLVLLKHQAKCAAVRADFVYTDLTQSSAQDFKELQRELASKSCELSAAQLNLHSWKQKAVVERLRLVSVQEDLTHQKVQIEALTAECNRRQEEYNVAQANFQAANEQKIQLGTELSKGAAASAKLQAQHDAAQPALRDKEAMLQALQAKLQEAESKLQALEQSGKATAHAAQQRQVAVEERARLSEQIAAAARERADMAEQRLAQRAELSQERQQHISDLTQERHMAAAERAAVTERSLRNEIISMQEAFQTSQAARLKDTDAVSQEMHHKLQKTQAELTEAKHQIAQRDGRIAVLEEACRHRDTSATPAKLAEQAMDTVSALVADLDVTEASLPGAVRHAAGPQAPDSSKPAVSKAVRGGKAKVVENGKGPNKPATVYSRQGKQPAAAGEQATRKAAAGKQAAAAEQAAVVSHADDHSPSNSRPARQRSKAQPYWMTGAAGNSPAPRAAQADPSACDAPMSPEADDSKPAEQSHVAAAKAGRAKKAGLTKRQTRTSPHKEQQQRQPAKRSRAASKQQPEHAECEGEPEADLESEAEAAADMAKAPQQPVPTADTAGTNQAEHNGQTHAGRMGQEDGDAAAAANHAAVMPNTNLEKTAQQHDEGKKASASQPTASEAAAGMGAPDAIAGALKRFGLKHPTRPVGVAKIDLASSFTNAFSPANAVSGATSKPTAAGAAKVGSGKPVPAGQVGLAGQGPNKENEDESARPAASKAQPAALKPMPQPPQALNSRVVAAAAARKGDQAGNQEDGKSAAPGSKATSQAGVGNKRKILKPVNVNYSTSGKHQDVLPANMLFGDAFMVPKLRK